jgi:hypothetical protein
LRPSGGTSALLETHTQHIKNTKGRFAHTQHIKKTIGKNTNRVLGFGFFIRV